MRLTQHRGRWTAVYYDADRKRHVHTFEAATEAEALPLFSAWQAAQRAKAAGAAVTVGDHFALWLKERSPFMHDVKRCEVAWRALGVHFAAMTPAQVDESTVADYIAARRAADVGDGTIRLELGKLASAMAHALRKGRISLKPSIPLPPPVPAKDRVLTVGEYRKLLGGAFAPHVRLFIELGLHTMQRTSAILTLKWTQVDFDRKRIDFRGDAPVTRKGRAIVRMDDHLAAALLAARRIARTDYVIEYGGRPVKDISGAFGEACKAARLDGVTPHTLRHTSASWQLERGVELRKVSRMLAHSSERTTEKTYAHRIPGYQLENTDAIKAMLADTNNRP